METRDAVLVHSSYRVGWVALPDQYSVHTVVVESEWRRDSVVRWQVYSPIHSKAK